MKKNKLLLIGWDAADWDVIFPLIAKGQMPTLKKIIENGVYGNMSTMNPPFSPMLWTSVATGKTPDKHGVLGFIEPLDDNSGIRPITVTARKTRALWNIFHNQGLKSNVVGWWPSYPAEPINGTVVSDKFQKVTGDPKKQQPIPDDAIYPKEKLKEFKELKMFPHEITSEHVLPFIPNAALVDQEKNKGLVPTAKIISENVSVHNAATRLLRTSDWDFMAIYYDMIDHFCHAYMKYHPPQLKGVTDQQYKTYKEAVNGAYRFQDMMLERLLDLAGEDVTVMVMSDHGFESGHKRMLKMPKVQAAAAMDHRQFGIFVASGPNIKKNEKVYGLGLIDVAPTILYHFNLPIGKDMDGNVALDIFKDSKSKIQYVNSWDKIEGDFGELKNREEKSDTLSDEETLNQLIELGYIEKPDGKIEKAVKKTKCDLKHNLARVYIGKKDMVNAKEILLDLINEDEQDKAPFYMDLISIYLKEKDFEKAENYFNLLKKSKTEVTYNLYFIESEILQGNGKPLKALKVLEDVVEQSKTKRPNAELWYKIGVLRNALNNFDAAQIAFEKAIEIESGKSKYHVAIAENLIDLKEYEEAAEYALTAIELVKYNSIAHYTLGRALEKLGDLENAKIAYETASRLKPKTYSKVEKAIENVVEKINKPLNLKDKSASKGWDNQITIVSGLPRSGTSLMMQMMDKGGIDTLTDGKRKADHSNPKGYYEYEKVMSLHKDNSWLSEAQNKSLKVVAPLLKFLDPKYRYKIIFMKRDIDEVLLSQQKMIGKDKKTISVSMYNSFYKQLEFVDHWKEKQPGVELIYIDYKNVLENPQNEIKKVESFIGKDLNKKAMEKCVDKSLYRNKVEEVK
ncbi:alkaline phosphatase family protein [Mesonia sp. K7]|uniref:alkaline phosphatase family protein n=1 Tax=Mesonia sp. K7 TaxID=2218606 RepID=UPI000DA82E10|nr:alkaline phosphatase family protein [Mesonia sp. K7]PZD77700.1 hypothetical protein DNG35_07635 [Mesonia sp. K7]